MKKLAMSVIGLLTLSVGIYSCTKDEVKNVVNQTRLKAAPIEIIWDIARKKCKNCGCGFGLCNPHSVDPGGDRAKSVSLLLLSPTQLEIKFNSNIDDVREGELNFNIEENLSLPADICLLLNVSNLELISGDYPYNPVSNSVIISVQ